MLQEVITEPGLFFDERYDWVLVYGKKEGEWRGEGVLYHTSQGLHYHSTVHQYAVSTTIKSSQTGRKTRLVAAHLPHHATLDTTLQLLEDWGRAMPKSGAILGVDANEWPDGPSAHTARGEEVLHHITVWGMHLPPQALGTPTYHPYNTAMHPRRLDYLFLKGASQQRGGRHQASSSLGGLGRLPPPAPLDVHMGASPTQA